MLRCKLVLAMATLLAPQFARGQKPELATVKITSSNSEKTLAKQGDTVTLNMVSRTTSY